jgi:hypothetical protein
VWVGFFSVTVLLVLVFGKLWKSKKSSSRFFTNPQKTRQFSWKNQHITGSFIGCSFDQFFFLEELQLKIHVGCQIFENYGYVFLNLFF